MSISTISLSEMQRPNGFLIGNWWQRLKTQWSFATRAHRIHGTEALTRKKCRAVCLQGGHFI